MDLEYTKSVQFGLYFSKNKEKMYQKMMHSSFASRHLLQHPNGHNNDNNPDLLICFDVFLETIATNKIRKANFMIGHFMLLCQ